MWFPVDDAFHSHPKAQRAGDEALGMWVRAGSHCMAYLTDGFVAEWWVKQQPKGVAKARKLVDAELWRRGENDGEPGWWFHDWKPENLKVNVLAAREQARQRKAKSRQKSRVTGHVTHASVPPTTPPHTTPHHSNTVVTKGGDLALVDARDELPPPHCAKHPKGTDDRCGPCGAARRNREELDRGHAERARAQREAEQQDALEAKLAAIAVCEICDDDGYDGTRVCDHIDRSSIAKAGAARARAALRTEASA
ncbi:Uncharacterised protein [Mycobacteroides abscessus subsp. abscessus]|uniref:hypothetical protein n=1 Tax=Mycobacteroides abscessus TaxID=36809 RepID=UPI000927F24A|nr:hypothetical protein [Mycobacteroides abscessus]SHS64837.1 Uncharacterised protein [Mycobacteroides abscessus subsp. abscessus]